ncbi:hypothetical protein BZA05DRAFT_131125 [Tricharina praecox]|uniref:uncharacterized protein n=1 Tax=Tricharina praecox TaxID=43433 RepID=UPI00221F58C5|nr:uncharacterized protein BZA05DRAFT_131125 [Tricharina praecox]KAI5846954.1 hypothetical protein BZA05DRAFT_131125 [Tricharina praecox]
MKKSMKRTYRGTLVVKESMKRKHTTAHSIRPRRSVGQSVPPVPTAKKSVGHGGHSNVKERWPERPSYPRYEKEHRPQRSSRSAEEQELRHEEAHEGRRLSPRQLARQEKNRREPRGENEKHRYNYERQDKPHESNSHPRSYDPRSASGIQNPSFPKIYRPGTPFSHAVSTTNTRAVVVVVGGTCTREKKTGMQMGIGCYFGPESPHNIRQRLGMLFDKQRKNDQRAEVGSALAALKVLATELGEDVTVGEIIIVTNSIFLHRAMTESVQEWRAAGWTDSKGDTVANNDLIDELDGVMVGLEKEGVEVKLWLVNRQFTNVANALARQACKLPLREKDKVTALKFGKRGGVAEVEVKKEAKKAEAAKKAEVAKKAEAAGNIGFWGWGGAAAVVVSIPALMVLEWPFM